MAPIDLCLDDSADCWNGGCVTERVVNNDPLLVNYNSTAFVGINVAYVRLCGDDAADAAATGLWSDSTCSATSCLNDGICQQSWNGYKYVRNSSLFAAFLLCSRFYRRSLLDSFCLSIY